MDNKMTVKIKEELTKQGIELSPAEMKQLEELLSKCDSISEDELIKICGGVLSSKMKKALTIVGALGVGALIIGGSAYTLNKYKKKSQPITTTPAINSTANLPTSRASGAPVNPLLLADTDNDDDDDDDDDYVDASETFPGIPLPLDTN